MKNKIDIVDLSEYIILLCFGMLCAIFPNTIIKVLAYIIGIYCIFEGVKAFIRSRGLKEIDFLSYNSVSALLYILVGIMFIVFQNFTLQMVSILLGFVCLFLAYINYGKIAMMKELKLNYKRTLILSIILFILGILFIVSLMFAFQMIIIGVGLVIYAITKIYYMFKCKPTEDSVRQIGKKAKKTKEDAEIEIVIDDENDEE